MSPSNNKREKALFLYGLNKMDSIKGDITVPIVEETMNFCGIARKNHKKKQKAYIMIRNVAQHCIFYYFYILQP